MESMPGFMQSQHCAKGLTRGVLRGGSRALFGKAFFCSSLFLYLGSSAVFSSPKTDDNNTKTNPARCHQRKIYLNERVAFLLFIYNPFVAR